VGLQDRMLGRIYSASGGIDVSCGRIGRRGRSSPTPLRMIRASCPPWDLARMVQALLQRRLISIMSPATFAELATGVHRSTRQPAFARAGINLAILVLPGSTRNVFLVGAEHGTMANQRRKRKPLTQSHFRT
ncbi:MAG: hypothetical protein ABI955_01610, partial [Nitrospirota bacterium]